MSPGELPTGAVCAPGHGLLRCITGDKIYDGAVIVKIQTAGITMVCDHQKSKTIAPPGASLMCMNIFLKNL